MAEHPLKNMTGYAESDIDKVPVIPKEKAKMDNSLPGESQMSRVPDFLQGKSIPKAANRPIKAKGQPK